jgi:osmotically-inducible protein OsmY
MLKSTEITVVTFKGRVQLSGFVSTRSSVERSGAWPWAFKASSM